MKSQIKFLSILFAACQMLCIGGADAVVQIKKKSPVSVQKQEAIGLLSGNSLIPTAMGLVSNVMALSKQQAELTAECEPTSSEIEFVKSLMQEWAMAGGTMPNLSDRIPCQLGIDYAKSVSELVDGEMPCYNSFKEEENQKQIYYQYPFPGKGFRPKDASAPTTNAKNRIIMSDLYEMFAAIGFEDADYLPNEVSQIERLKERAVKCAPAALSAKRRELWGSMLTQTVGGLGQKYNAENTISQIGSIVSGGGGSPLGSVMSALPMLSGSLLGGQ